MGKGLIVSIDDLYNLIHLYQKVKIIISYIQNGQTAPGSYYTRG